MRNPKLVPYEMIVRAASGGPEAIQPLHSPALTFPGLEIRLHQRQVLKDETDIYLTRLEYGSLCYLATSPGRVFTKMQIFESVWSMENESCQSSVASVIYNLRKKIEPDRERQNFYTSFTSLSHMSKMLIFIHYEDICISDIKKLKLI